jgi:3-hydroxyanthranilate 3,4-dioxygenase
MISSPFNLQKWIEEHRETLKPPVGNAEVYAGEAEDFIVMMVGGPNARNDYHYNESEELYYQLEGQIRVNLLEAGQFRDVTIGPGDMFLLPPKVPHCPVRPAGSIGLVLEKKRGENDVDGFIWYCPNCGNKLYEEYFHLTDIVKQLPPVMQRFNQSEELRTCNHCGYLMPAA